MLLDEHRRRSENRDLLAVLNGLERRADRDLGLSVADVAADQQVHGPRLLHRPLDLFRHPLLIRRLVVDEGGLHLALPAGVGAESVGLVHAAGRVEFEQLGGHRLDGVLSSLLQPLPAATAKAMQPRRRAVRAVVHVGDPALHQIGSVVRYPQDVAARVLDDQRLQFLAADPHPLESAVAPDAMVEMHDVIAGR